MLNLNPKVFIQKVKGYITQNPKRAKFIGLIAIAVFLPLIVVAALTVQNLQQKASESDVVRITDASGNTLTETTTPNVFISLNLPPNWILPNIPSANNGLIEKVYASACFENCMDAGTLTAAQCHNNCGESVTVPLPTATSVPATPTPIPPITTNTPFPTAKQALPTSSCEALNPVLYKCASSCNSLGTGWDKQTNFDVSCPNNQQCCYYQTPLTPTPTSAISSVKHVLKQITVENIIPLWVLNVGGGTGGGEDVDTINIAGINDFPSRFSWKLVELPHNSRRYSERRDVQATFTSDNGFTEMFVGSTILTPEQTSITSGSTVIQSGSSVIRSGSSLFIQSGSSLFKQSQEYLQHVNLDLDRNGVIDEKDVKVIESQVNKRDFDRRADINGDGVVDGVDINLYLRAKAIQLGQ